MTATRPTLKPIIVALAGNPNSGKTTIFNALTGLRYKVANYPGVTVEKKQGRLNIAEVEPAFIVDLPGIYSLSGSSIDETIAARALFGEIAQEPTPDLIISVVDAGNLERNLFLTSQLLDLSIPMILVVNMIDAAEKDGIVVRYEILSRLLDLPVVPLVARKKQGIEELKREIQKALKSKRISKRAFSWLPPDSSYAKWAERIGRAEVEGTLYPDKLLGASLLSESAQPKLEESRTLLEEARAELSKEGIDSYSFEATSRYRWMNSVVTQSCVIEREETKKLYERIDSFITHKFWGSLTFLAIMAFIFQSIFMWASIPMDFIDSIFVSLGSWVSSLLPQGIIKSLIVDGIIAGVGSVVIFVPQIALLFFFLGLLEDSGYLSRAAFLMDKLMRKVGLQGRSFIPLLSSFACAIPGIMSTRTIPSFADRMTTIMIAPLMSCSARLPVYTLLISAFIPNKYYFGFISLQGLTLLAMYLLGVVAAAIIAWLLKFSLLRGEPALFVMEMPRFRKPAMMNVLRDVYDRIKLFVINAGTVILACSVVLWFLASYPKGEVKDSFAGRIGTFMEPAIEPLGFNWEIGVGILASFAAREVFISSLSTVYNLQASDDDSARSLLNVLTEKKAAGTFTTLTAISLMVFYVFACQCMSTLAVCKRETGSWRWTGFMFLYMTGLAYIASFITYNGGKILLNGWSL